MNNLKGLSSCHSLHSGQSGEAINKYLPDELEAWLGVLEENTREGEPFFVLPEPNGQLPATCCILTSDSWSLRLASRLLILIPSVRAGNRRTPHATVTDTHQRQATDIETEQEKAFQEGGGSHGQAHAQ